MARIDVTGLNTLASMEAANPMAPMAELPAEYRLPLNISDKELVPLMDLQHAELQGKLDEIVRSNPKWTKLRNSKRLSIGLVDMRNPFAAKFAQVNGNNMMYAASLPKIAVLLTAMEALECGELANSAEVRADMRLMIAKSNNAASTRMIDRVGFDRIAEVMQDPRYELYDKEQGGGLWVGKRYAASGERRGDPMKNLSHAATAAQVCRYYYLLAYGRLVSMDRSKEMLTYLGNPELHHKFVGTFDRVAPLAKIFRKSGSYKNFHCDSALVWGKGWRKYIIVGLVEDASGEQIMRQIAAAVDKKLKPR